MKYYVVVDTRGYILNIAHTGTIKDYVELNLDEYDLSKKRAYKLGKNELIFDEDEWARIVAEEQAKTDEKEIAELQSFLEETNDYPTRAFEEILSLTNPVTWIADVIKINIKYKKQYAKVLTKRVEAWKRLDELKGG